MRQPPLTTPPRPAPPLDWRSLSWLAPVLVLLAAFFYLWLRVEPALEYQARTPIFLLSRSFLAPFLKRPGGPAEYGAAFLAQFKLPELAWSAGIRQHRVCDLLIRAIRNEALRERGWPDRVAFSRGYSAGDAEPL